VKKNTALSSLHTSVKAHSQKEIFASGIALVVLFVILLMVILVFNSILIIGIVASLGACCTIIALFRLFCTNLNKYVQLYEKTLVILKRMQGKSNYLESILQDSTDIIFTTDIDGHIFKFNKGSENHFGYTQIEIVGKPLKFLFANEDDAQKLLNSIQVSNRAINEETPMRTKRGDNILLDISISRMNSDSGSNIGFVVTARDITEKKKLENELILKNELLNKLAITDELSGLFNSRHFYDQLNKELARLYRNPQRRLSLIMLDIDHFKDYNDTQGHQAGDTVIHSMGQVINLCIRKDLDSGYRYGGDEFGTILPDTDKQDALIVAERIQHQFKAFKYGKTSLSIGIAEFIQGDTAETLVKAADNGLYQSKNNGRNRITVHSR
jgi:diguanylate cyclase (GGDEF)-like protein/PAS domain S-box-containing protein